MKNEDMPAMPTSDIDLIDKRDNGLDELGGHVVSLGMTKREKVLMEFMSALLSNSEVLMLPRSKLLEIALFQGDVYFENC